MDWDNAGNCCTTPTRPYPCGIVLHVVIDACLFLAGACADSGGHRRDHRVRRPATAGSRRSGGAQRAGRAGQHPSLCRGYAAVRSGRIARVLRGSGTRSGGGRAAKVAVRLTGRRTVGATVQHPAKPKQQVTENAVIRIRRTYQGNLLPNTHRM